jgi:hypothetical protein
VRYRGTHLAALLVTLLAPTLFSRFCLHPQLSVTAEPCDDNAAQPGPATETHSDLGGAWFKVTHGEGVRGLLDKMHHPDVAEQAADHDTGETEPYPETPIDVRLERMVSQAESSGERGRQKEKDTEKVELKRLLLFANGAKLEAEAKLKELRQLVDTFRLKADAAGTATRRAHRSARAEHARTARHAQRPLHQTLSAACGGAGLRHDLVPAQRTAPVAAVPVTSHMCAARRLRAAGGPPAPFAEMKEIAMADELRVLKMECERSLGEAERQISEYSARSDEIGAELRALASAPSTPSAQTGCAHLAYTRFESLARASSSVEPEGG